MRAMTTQWMGLEREHANALVPVLVSSQQGLGKSTFCRQILPESLRAYYLDNLNLAGEQQPQLRHLIPRMKQIAVFRKNGTAHPQAG